jgi:vancomycin resistance protein VanW
MPKERAVAADRGVFSHVQAMRATELRRSGTEYAAAIQAAKERNVETAASRIDGMVIRPGETFSWHRRVGPPLASRGFVRGPELHDGRLALGIGGGLCQVANLLYWLAIHSGLEVVERHRHGLDMFPDAARDVPFGCGATVFYPHRDLKLRNRTTEPLLIEMHVVGGRLHGVARFENDPGFRVRIVETRHRFRREPTGTYRENRLERWWYSGRECVRKDLLTENRARVLYDV